MSKAREMKKRNARIAKSMEFGWLETPTPASVEATVIEGGVIVSGPKTKDGGTVEAEIVAAPAAKAKSARGTCPVCGRSEKVRKDGTMTKHGAHDNPCAGTGTPELTL